MASPPTRMFRLRDADSGKRLPSNGQPFNARDLEYSVKRHFLMYGEWPQAYPTGFYAVSSNGEPESAALASPIPLQLFSRSRGTLLTGEAYAQKLIQRQILYEKHAKDGRAKLAENARKTIAQQISNDMISDDEEEVAEFDPEQALIASASHKSLDDIDIRLRSGKRRHNVHVHFDYVMQVTQQAIRLTRERMGKALEYFDNLAVNGLAQLNELKEVKYPSFNDLEPAKSFDELINTIHAMSIEDAKRELTYESLYEFMKRPEVLRIQLRRIDQDLASITPPPTPPSGTSNDLQPQTSWRRSEASWAWVQHGVPMVQNVLDRLLAFVAEISLDVVTLEENVSDVPLQMIKMWDDADADGKRRIVAELFAEGMTKDNEKFLDVTHFTAHFRRVRSLVLVSVHRAFCAHLKGIGEGIQEMRAAIVFEDEVE
ncbi:hypothetical protein BKA66DRAFT_443453 [Pyrenochaeta sp. MPI-SDFR-AT-0127]|nr:hypothetical protein BKA66DRAFT_443453 [Pyrenochaeta sp. MPI-SDFR-AT-0127]